MTTPLAIGVDVGGTKIAAGIVDAEGRIGERLRRDSPAGDATGMVNAIAELVTELASRHDVMAAGIGAAGWVAADRRTMLFAPNIAWRDLPLADEVQDKTGVPIVVENDANAAAWGEFRFGAAEDSDDLVMIAVGTGVGGGIVLDGELVRGSFGIAAEVGHFRVVPGGRLCGCGQHGCWEQYASGRALVTDAKRRAASEPAAERLLRRSGGNVEDIRGPLITELALAGDPFCVDVLAELGRWLGEGIASLTAVLDPAVVVIGGGVSAAGDLLLEPTRRAFVATVPVYDGRPALELRLATLGNDAGLIGAADLARRRR
jgi:glucokinase